MKCPSPRYHMSGRAGARSFLTSNPSLWFSARLKGKEKVFPRKQSIVSVSLRFKRCMNIAFNNSLLILLIIFKRKSPIRARR